MTEDWFGMEATVRSRDGAIMAVMKICWASWGVATKMEVPPPSPAIPSEWNMV